MKAHKKNHNHSRQMNEDGIPKPEKPDVKPQTDQPEIKKPVPPEVTPGKVKEPEIPASPRPGEPEIHPGKKVPDIPSPAPPEPHE